MEQEYLTSPKEKGTWQGYNRSATEQEVKSTFKEKYGYEPEKTIGTGGCWLVGPINERTV